MPYIASLDGDAIPTSIPTPGSPRARWSSAGYGWAVAPTSGTARCSAATTSEIVVGEECNIQDLCCLHSDPGRARRPGGPGQPRPQGDGARRPRRDRRAHRHRRDRARRRQDRRGFAGRGRRRSCGPARRSRPGVLVAGVPGKIVRELTDDDRDSFARTPATYWPRRSGTGRRHRFDEHLVGHRGGVERLGVVGQSGPRKRTKSTVSFRSGVPLICFGVALGGVLLEFAVAVPVGVGGDAPTAAPREGSTASAARPSTCPPSSLYRATNARPSPAQHRSRPSRS